MGLRERFLMTFWSPYFSTCAPHSSKLNLVSISQNLNWHKLQPIKLPRTVRERGIFSSSQTEPSVAPDFYSMWWKIVCWFNCNSCSVDSRRLMNLLLLIFWNMSEQLLDELPSKWAQTYVAIKVMRPPSVENFNFVWVVWQRIMTNNLLNQRHSHHQHLHFKFSAN